MSTNVKHIQTVTLSLSVLHDYPGYFMGGVNCTVSPPVEGQEILINHPYIGGTIRTNKNGQATSRDGRLNKNSTVTFTLKNKLGDPIVNANIYPHSSHGDDTPAKTNSQGQVTFILPYSFEISSQTIYATEAVFRGGSIYNEARVSLN